MDVPAGSIDVTTYFVFRLTATGIEATGLDITTMDLQYVRSGAVPVAKVDAVALGATDTAHTDNRAIAVDDTDQPGLYRVDWPDAAFAIGAREVILSVKCATVFTEHLRVQLTALGLDRAIRCIGYATVGSASTTTSIVTSSIAPSAAVTDQFKGRIVLFDSTTTTTNLRGQATDITGSSTGGVLTVTALTTAPVSGDTFVIQ